MFVNERLKTLRQMSGLTLKQVSEYLGITEGTVQRYESGLVKVIPYDAIQKLAELYKVSPSFIMGWELQLSDIKPLGAISQQDADLLVAFHSSPQSIQEAIEIILGLKERL